MGQVTLAKMKELLSLIHRNPMSTRWVAENLWPSSPNKIGSLNIRGELTRYQTFLTSKPKMVPPTKGGVHPNIQGYW